MLCPGSLRHALPQVERIARAFSTDEVAVIGLHMVFENHKDMTPSLLEPFLKSENITIPVLVDAPNGSGIPKTMQAYSLQGTPTLLLFDRQGRLRRHYLGAVDDLRLGAEIMALAWRRRTPRARCRWPSSSGSPPRSSIPASPPSSRRRVLRRRARPRPRPCA